MGKQSKLKKARRVIERVNRGMKTAPEKTASWLEALPFVVWFFTRRRIARNALMKKLHEVSYAHALKKCAHKLTGRK